MLVLGVAALVALVAGGLVSAAALVWPRIDPTSPAGRSVADELAERPEAAADLDDEGNAERAAVLGLSAAAVAVAASVTIFGLLFVLVRTHAGFAQLDLGPARWAARQVSPGAATVLRTLTSLGATAFALPLVLVVGIVEARRLSNRSIALFLLLVEGGQLLLANLVKVMVSRARPDLEQLAGTSSHSFPSGHTATAAATFAALALLLGRGRRPIVRVALAGAAAGLTALVASTRVLLGVHWLTDVLAGAALGWGWAAVCSIAFGGRLLRFGAPIEQGIADARSGASAGG